MTSNFSALSGVGIAGMPRTRHAVVAITAAAHPAFAASAAYAGRPAAAFWAPRKRRTATATHASVNRGTT